jgi:hypothetical protein
MNNWKSLLEQALAEQYPGVYIKWNGDDPTLVIPDELENKALEIVECVTALWSAEGGEVEFYPERAVRTDGVA